MSRELAAEALFVSLLQPSDEPCRERVSAAVEAMLLLHGSEGCVALMACEYGEHPEATADRMAWCLRMVAARVPVPA